MRGEHPSLPRWRVLRRRRVGVSEAVVFAPMGVARGKVRAELDAAMPVGPRGSHRLQDGRKAFDEVTDARGGAGAPLSDADIEASCAVAPRRFAGMQQQRGIETVWRWSGSGSRRLVAAFRSLKV